MAALSPEKVYREMIEHADELDALLAMLAQGPHPTAEANAAAEELGGRLGEVAAREGKIFIESEPANNLRRLALQVATASATLRHKTRWCPHAMGLDRVTYHVISLGWAFCTDCVDDYVPGLEEMEEAQSDLDCDLCGELQPAESPQFWPTAYQDGLQLFTFSACESCHGFTRRMISEEPG
jgi:hypothetical protein